MNCRLLCSYGAVLFALGLIRVETAIMYKLSSYEDDTYDYGPGILACIYIYHRFIYVGEYEKHYAQVLQLLIQAEGNPLKLKKVNDLVNWSTPRATKERHFLLRDIRSYNPAAQPNSLQIKFRDGSVNSMTFVKPEDYREMIQGLTELNIPPEN